MYARIMNLRKATRPKILLALGGWNHGSGKFSDMFELFHLPSLYPQYVFLVQIPLDLMLAWQKYHQDRKMEQTSTTGNQE